MSDFSECAQHSNITEIFISGLKVPVNIFEQGLEEMNINEWEVLEQKVSFYNQFSTVFERQGFLYDAVKYRALSALNQERLLWKKLLNRNQNKGNRLTSSVFLEYFPFLLNHISNNHGESWGRALLFLIFTSVVLFIFYLLSIGHEFSINRDLDFTFIGYYFEFINPFRPFEFMQGTGFSINAWTKIIDFFSRVIIGYSIYQFLAAFRKYKKK